MHSVKRRLTQRRKDAKKDKNDPSSWQRKNCPPLRALRLCETLPLPQREKAAHAKAQRRKERQERPFFLAEKKLPSFACFAALRDPAVASA
jgi:hypothetical protein